MGSLLFYLGSFVAMIFLAALSERCFRKGYKKLGILLIVLILCALVVIAGFRQNVGTDYKSYVAMYNNYSYLEPGNRLIFDIAHVMSDDYRVVFVLYALVTNSIALYAIYRNRNNASVALSVAAYLFVIFPFTLNVMRQGVAIAACLLVYVYFLEGRLKRSLILTIIAMLFHPSAAIVVPFLVATMMSKDKKIVRNSILMSVMMAGLIIVAYRVFGMSFGSNGEYSNYIESTSFGVSSIILMASYLPFLIFFRFFGKRINDRKTNILKGAVLFGVVFEFIFSSSEVSRCALYFTSALVVLMPMPFEKMQRNTNTGLIKMLYIGFLIAYFVIVYNVYGRAGIFPYSNSLIGVAG